MSRKNKKQLIKNVFRIASYNDPSRPGIKVHLCMGRFSDINVDAFVNNEETNLRTVEKDLLPFHEEIMELMKDEEKNPVSLLHSGALVAAAGIQFDGGNLYGDYAHSGNGAHSLDIVRRFQLGKKVPNQYLPFRFIEGKMTKELLSNIIKRQQEHKSVKVKSRINHDGGFNWIKVSIKGKSYAVKVSYQEGQVKKDCPIDIQTIVTLMALVHADSGRNPQTAYLQKKGLMYFYEKNWRTFQKIEPILSDVLTMRDVMEGIVLDAIGEKNWTKKENGILVDKVKLRGKFVSPFINADRKARCHGGSLMPIFSTLRNFTTINREGNVTWKKGWDLASLKTLYVKVMPKLVSHIKDAAANGKNGADKIAKDTSLWTLLNNEVKSAAKL